ncbi:MAG: SEC-C metal-binding domain-containing protein [Acidobacteriota bacterium]|nr:SEC-C metal-binding domain-containing protein [Acidobacteriota bacterium]
MLAYHLRSNLWISNELDFVMIGDDVAVDLDIAMAARRTGIPGTRTPKGILTRLQSTVIAQILSEIEDKGVCLRPGDLEIRTGVTLQHEWKQDATLDDVTKGMAGAVVGFSSVHSRPRAQPKTGRNDSCPCGSGKKYKKCCLGR